MTSSNNNFYKEKYCSSHIKHYACRDIAYESNFFFFLKKKKIIIIKKKFKGY